MRGEVSDTKWKSKLRRVRRRRSSSQSARWRKTEWGSSATVWREAWVNFDQPTDWFDIRLEHGSYGVFPMRRLIKFVSFVVHLGGLVACAQLVLMTSIISANGLKLKQDYLLLNTDKHKRVRFTWISFPKRPGRLVFILWTWDWSQQLFNATIDKWKWMTSTISCFVWG